MTRDVDAAIAADEQAFRERYRDGGVPALQDGIDARLLRDVEDNAIYLLADPQSRPIAGNLRRWPQDLADEGAPGPVRIDKPDSSMARAEHFTLPGGYHLLIGRDVHKRDEVAHLVAGAMIWQAGLMLVLAVAGAIAVRSLFRLTLADVSATTTAISAGDLSRRMPITGRGDEFDMLAETINDMLDRIGLLMDGVRHVSNAIAHDLRTPIARARARLEYAARPGASEAELRAAIERAQADLDGVVRIFQALLRIAEIESGSRRSAFAPFDLAALLEDLGEMYEAAAEEASQRLMRIVPPRLAAFGDREMIQQAVANLLDNALKFSPAGGIIQLRANVEDGGPCIVVADHGPGMSDPERQEAGRRFFRAESARSTPGSGLGLALVQAVATLHGGSFRLEDNGPGLRAVLCLLPVAPAERTSGERPTGEKRTEVDPSSRPAQHDASLGAA